nr:FAD-binding oxidoreductase [Desulfobacterales bacterium]
MLTDTFQRLYDQLKPLVPEERLIHDDLRTLAYGTDASFYRYVPNLIVKVESEREVIATLQACRALGLAITFRAAGTSLSGQACTDSVLMVLGDKGWHDHAIAADQSEITLQAGLRGAQANRYLAPYGKKIGPDPASIDSAKIGGIVANNACGMASGIELNSQYTLKDIRLIFADGTVLDTRDEHSRQAFLSQKKDWIDRLQALSARLKGDPALVEKIQRKYKIKNTTGYSVNALIEQDDPIKMIQHLIVGSEGTLAFISDVTFRTAEEPSTKATSLMLFPDIATMCEAVLILQKCPVQAAELMDRLALRTVENKPGVPDHIKTLGPDVTALLVETAANDEAGLEANIKEIGEKLKPINMAHEYHFTTDPAETAALWTVRKGIFPSACSERPVGTAVIIEDIAVPVESLGDCLLELQKRFDKYDYRNCVIWGHVFDGNVHFVLTPDFSNTAEIKKYKTFMTEVVDLVVDRYDGSLKAEHGTGRNMAPFVEKEWGPEIYGVMREIK